MPTTIDTTQVQIMTDIRTFLLSILPAGVEVVQGQLNRVAEPPGPDYVMMLPIDRAQMTTNINLWNQSDPNAASWTAMQPTRLDIQLDVHGPNSEDNLQIISTLARDYFGTAAMGTATITPLYTDDAIQAPFLNAEGQFENRWTMKMAFEIDPTVSTTQQFASNVSTSIYRAGP